jgi:hypothetical protein
MPSSLFGHNLEAAIAQADSSLIGGSLQELFRMERIEAEFDKQLFVKFTTFVRI